MGSTTLTVEISMYPFKDDFRPDIDAFVRTLRDRDDLRVRIEPALMRYVVEKGSITVDGISLTVVDALDDGFTAAIIPHTADVTTLGTKSAGSAVNIEIDVTAKYVEKLLAWKVDAA